LPLLVTRSLVVFPNTNQPIEAARPFSMKAIEESRDNASSLLLSCRKKTQYRRSLLKNLYQSAPCAALSICDQKHSIDSRDGHQAGCHSSVPNEANTISRWRRP
jgi:ATP-dependent Lon protease